MPKLLYFPVQGRAQAIRYMLGSKGVEFEDKHVEGPEWGPMKAAGTYGEGAKLPVWVLDDGTYFTQSMAILKMLAMEHGYAPTTARAVYEVEWWQMQFSDMVDGKILAIMKDDATEEERQNVITILGKWLDVAE